MNVRKLRHVLDSLLDKEYWKLEHNTAVLLSYRALSPLPDSFQFVNAKATDTGFELKADGDIWQDLRDDLQRIYGESSFTLDTENFIGYAKFKCE